MSILEAVEKGHHQIKKQGLFAGMVANAWYTINYFNLSFGKQDRLQRAIKQILSLEHIAIDAKKEQIIETLSRTAKPDTIRHLRYFDGEVPYRFLSPWFSRIKGSKHEIYQLSQDFSNDCLYTLNEHEVIINPKWIAYLTENSGILKAFCYWHLCIYLQKHNPNVPDIANKLFKRPQRSGLLKQRKEFWDIVINKSGPVKCIYTDTYLHLNAYAVEHFVPFAFVSHDLIWNLIPADKRFNSSKSDKLPIMDKHFDAYFELQELAMKTIFDVSPANKLLQDYLTILPDLNALNSLNRDTLKIRFRENIQPLITIAANNGFQYMS